MSAWQNRLMLTGLICGLFLLAAGIYLWVWRALIWDAGLCFVLGLLSLGITFLRAAYPSPPAKYAALHVRLAAWLTSGPNSVWRVVALALSLVVGFESRRQAPDADFTALFGLWVIAVGIFAVSLPGGRRAGQGVEPLGRQASLALGGLLLAAFLARAINLGGIPANFGGDEGTQALLSLRLVERPLGNPFATGWYSVPTLSFLLYGWAMRLCGASMAGARALSALVGTLTVYTTFLLGRDWGGRRVGWVAAAVVAFSAYHLHFSRLASNQIFDPLIATLGFWLLCRALSDCERGEVSAAWGWAGLVLGLGWTTYFGARWVSVIAAVFLGLRGLTLEPQARPRYRRGVFWLLSGWAVITIPLWLWYAAHPTDLLARSSAVSIFTSGWLAREIQITGRSVFFLLGQQFWKSVTAFHLTPDPTFWYHPERPLLDFVSGVLLLVGMVAVFWRARSPGRALTLLWFWSTLVMAWTLTENPPSSQRGLLLVPAVALCIAWGVEALLEICGAARKWDSRVVRRWVGVLMVMVAVLNLGFYFARYTPRRVYGNPTAWIGTEVARYCQSHPAEGMTYFFGAPFMYWDFGTLAFLLRDQVGVDVQPGEFPEVTAPARFIFVPERAAELAEYQQRYPGGHLHELRADDAHVLALIYEW